VREQAIKRAAVKSIARYGAKKVAVEDIAMAAGVSRRTFYRFFTGRRAVMEAVLMDRLEKIAEGIKAAVRKCSSFEEAVIAGTVATMRLAGADSIYLSIVEDDPALPVERRAGADSPLEKLFLSIWSDVLQGAQQTGVLRGDITVHDAATWLMDVHAMLIQHVDMDEAQKVERLRTFVLPSLMTRPPEA
jgi:AcrR family transcriptional regulator